MIESMAFSQFVPSPEHPWGDTTRQLVFKDIYQQNVPGPDWDTEVREWMGLERYGAAPYVYHGLYMPQNSE